MVSAKFTQKIFTDAGLRPVWPNTRIKRIHLFLLIVLVYIRLVIVRVATCNISELPVSPVSPVNFYISNSIVRSEIGVATSNISELPASPLSPVPVSPVNRNFFSKISDI